MNQPQRKLIQLDFYELKRLLQEAAELGAAANDKMREPTNDLIKQREAYRWLKSLGKEPILLEKMVNGGLIKKKRMGPAINSPICYSKLEIRSVLSSEQLMSVINFK